MAKKPGEVRLYTFSELFGMHTEIPVKGESWFRPRLCKHCGAAVLNPQDHLEFHNALSAMATLIGLSHGRII